MSMTLGLLPHTGQCRCDCTALTLLHEWAATMWIPEGPYSAWGGRWTALLLASLKPEASTTSSCSSRKTREKYTHRFVLYRYSLYIIVWLWTCLYLRYLCVQHFVPVFQKVHELDPQLFGTRAKVVMAAQCLRRPHLEINMIHSTLGV